jgi:hypothetical protein
MAEQLSEESALGIVTAEHFGTRKLYSNGVIWPEGVRTAALVTVSGGVGYAQAVGLRSQAKRELLALGSPDASPGELESNETPCGLLQRYRLRGLAVVITRAEAEKHSEEYY